MDFIRQGLALAAGLWGYAEADSTIVGIVVVAVVVLAVIYVAGRVCRDRNAGSSGEPPGNDSSKGPSNRRGKNRSLWG